MIGKGLRIWVDEIKYITKGDWTTVASDTEK